MQKIIAFLRIGIGWIFFWAFLDKLLGLGFATSTENAWIVGGSPTKGFLSFATKGPFADFFQGLAGSGLVDWLFMLGLLFVGCALIIGIGVRIASYTGALMLLLMYLAAFIPPEHNPILDEHIIYILIMFIFPMSDSSVLGVGGWWSKTNLVKKYPILR